MSDQTSPPLDPGELAVLLQLDHTRPTWDGDIIGKQPRASLIRRGLAFRSHGYTTLTSAGHAEKRRWQSEAA